MHQEVRGAESPEEIRRKLLALKDRIYHLSEIQREYGGKMLKFGFAAWIFGLCVFVTSLVFLRGLGFALKLHILSISLLIGAGAAPLLITALMVRKQRRMRNRLESMKNLVEEIYKRRLAEEKGEFLHSLLEHNIGNKIAVALSSLNQLAGEKLPGKKGKMVSMSLKAVVESSELLEKARLLKRIGKSVVVKIYDLDLAITRAIKRIKPEAGEKGIKIAYEKTDVFVQASPVLEELFFNLMENAIEHANCKKIKIGVRARGDDCTILVDDDGRGVPKELREKIFRKGISERAVGRGLGLYLVKKVVEIYDGDIQVTDSPLGGTRFTIRLKRVREVPKKHRG
jgi:signal transduction histidine kinase